ncbi:MAG: hypothetical protein HQK50_04585 [Oligoflexia bacterium]|nr:hypothetical protein [Oligoflexia bacterium]MBF0364822.1 hypothetical protein [Oligoflexia bacterium]
MRNSLGKLLWGLCLVFCFFFMPTLTGAQTGRAKKVVELTMSSYDTSQFLFMQELLEESLKSAGFIPKINSLGDNVTTQRVLTMLERDDAVNIHWLIRSKERDDKYIPVEVGISGGLIGQRILLIPAEEQHAYGQVKNLEDFRKLNKVAGFAKGWFDVDVWKKNDLKFYEKDGSWDPELYLMVAAKNRGIDYLSRGVNEIIKESTLPQASGLIIEKKLLFVYDSDFIFYLSKSGGKYKKDLELALNKAKRSGLMKKIINKYFPDAKKLAKGRRKIHLAL